MILQLFLGVVVFETCLFHTQSHVTRTALDKNFLSQPWPYMTLQLHLGLGRPMFAPAYFEPSDVRFNIRLSS